MKKYFFLCISLFFCTFFSESAHSSSFYMELGGEYEFSADKKIVQIKDLGSLSLSYYEEGFLLLNESTSDVVNWKGRRIFSNSYELDSNAGSGIYSSFGIEFEKGIGFGIEAGWKKNTESITNDLSNSPYANQYLDSNTIFAMIDIKMSIDFMNTPIVPYLGASLGFAKVNNQGSAYQIYYGLKNQDLDGIEVDIDDVTLSTSGSLREAKSVNPAYQLKAGFNFYMSDLVSLKLGYKYFSLSHQKGNLDNKTINSTYDIDTIENIGGAEGLILDYVKFEENSLLHKSNGAKQHSLDFALKFDLY